MYVHVGQNKVVPELALLVSRRVLVYFLGKFRPSLGEISSERCRAVGDEFTYIITSNHDDMSVKPIISTDVVLHVVCVGKFGDTTLRSLDLRLCDTNIHTDLQALTRISKTSCNRIHLNWDSIIIALWGRNSTQSLDLDIIFEVEIILLIDIRA